MIRLEHGCCTRQCQHRPALEECWAPQQTALQPAGRGMLARFTCTPVLMSVQEGSAGMLHSSARFRLPARKHVT